MGNPAGREWLQTRWRCPERFVKGEEKKSGTEREPRKSGRLRAHYTYTRTHVSRVVMRERGHTCARARAHSMSSKSAATPLLHHHHHRYTTTTKVRGVFVHESWVYLVLSVRIPRCDAPALRPSIFATARAPVIFLVKIRKRIDARSRKIDEHEIVNSVSRKWPDVAEATPRIFSRR